MSRIFITGATGFIGGEVLHGLASNSRLAAKTVALVRSEARAAQITAKYPAVEPLIADLDASDAIASAAAQADVVLLWIQISGASVLSGPEIANHSYGNASSRVYSDVEDIAELHRIVASSPKRIVDRLVTNLASGQPRVRTAIVYGPIIYGLGAGPVNRRSIQIPGLARATLRNGYAPHVGKGLSAWSNVHVSDIAQLILKLVAASQDGSGSEPKPLWNKDGVYFADAGKIPFGEIARKIATVAADKGLIESPAVKEVDAEAAESITAHAAVLLGTNAQTKGDRARTWLGWEPQGPSLEEEIERAVLEEAASSARPNI
ncbi:NAD(P)-binding domain protein [Cordyceps fumosorosea ARSEF 2679]|uniref:NAD(P)-binding domain protein n=1 Tax=Cordyceps fumosorosea (strain ARSEF 2679) TaxID=1081104 RepID=A0A167PNE2_CORFA|nr:NAD(P)-binding domain protein [Cordyceps fumosorosea ARSEF 2679]OAA56849.1 NAD(P)-binding domain protein [Cordyceps fumosorosea ARSEF 2679]